MRGDHSLWRELHALQTAMCFALELPAYYASPSWHEARTVLDAGTGHGDYLRGLARRFPEKTYVGVDIEPAYVEAARATAGERRGMRFVVDDVMALDGSYDFAVRHRVDRRS
jgi:tRNA G46 methylase TrmB